MEIADSEDEWPLLAESPIRDDEQQGKLSITTSERVIAGSQSDVKTHRSKSGPEQLPSILDPHLAIDPSHQVARGPDQTRPRQILAEFPQPEPQPGQMIVADKLMNQPDHGDEFHSASTGEQPPARNSQPPLPAATVARSYQSGRLPNTPMISDIPTTSLPVLVESASQHSPRKLQTPTTETLTQSSTTDDPQLKRLQSRTATLQSTLATQQAKRAALLQQYADLTNPSSSPHFTGATSDKPTDDELLATAKEVVRRHIKLLHDYNEIKDVGSALMGMVADARGVRIRDVQEEFGISGDD